MKSSKTTHLEKSNESDQQMLQRVAIRFAIIFLVVVMFDSILDWAISLLSIVIHLMHMIIEAIEYIIVLLFTEIFQTSFHQSEIILVNGVLILALFLSYRLINAAPQWFRGFKRDFRAACLRSIRRKSSCWRATCLARKIKCIGAYGAGTSCLFLVVS